MSAAININDILSTVKKLDKGQQLTLLETLAAIIKKDGGLPKPVKLSKISGIGSGIWKNAGIDKYIEQERQW